MKWMISTLLMLLIIGVTCVTLTFAESTQDCVISALGPGQYSELLLQYYRDGGATSGMITDAEAQFLVVNGATPATINDMWFEVLGELGYLGVVNTRKNRFWCIDGGVIPPAGFAKVTDASGIILTDQLGVHIVAPQI